MNRPPPPAVPSVMRDAVSYAITSRRSIRGFLPTPIDSATLADLLAIAGRAPSGSNIQPWKVHVLTGPALERLRTALMDAFESGVPEVREYQYYPRTWRDPYLRRRRDVGWALYQLAGVARGDKAAGRHQMGRNFAFFGAPAAMVFTIDKDMEQGSWLDYGMFLQSVMVAARGYGLDTCPQAAIAGYPDLLRRELGIAESEAIVCGMALGVADPAEPTNALATERETVETFSTFHHD